MGLEHGQALCSKCVDNVASWMVLEGEYLKPCVGQTSLRSLGYFAEFSLLSLSSFK